MAPCTQNKAVPGDAVPKRYSDRFSSPASRKNPRPNNKMCSSSYDKCSCSPGYRTAAPAAEPHRPQWQPPMFYAILDRRKLIYDRRRLATLRTHAAALASGTTKRGVPDDRRGGRLEGVAGRERQHARGPARGGAPRAFG